MLEQYAANYYDFPIVRGLIAFMFILEFFDISGNSYVSLKIYKSVSVALKNCIYLNKLRIKVFVFLNFQTKIQDLKLIKLICKNIDLFS